MPDKTLTTNPFTMMHRLQKLRNEMRTHNPESENVQTMDWAIHTLNEVVASVRRLDYLRECINGKN